MASSESAEIHAERCTARRMPTGASSWCGFGAAISTADLSRNADGDPVRGSVSLGAAATSPPGSARAARRGGSSRRVEHHSANIRLVAASGRVSPRWNSSDPLQHRRHDRGGPHGPRHDARSDPAHAAHHGVGAGPRHADGSRGRGRALRVVGNRSSGWRPTPGLGRARPSGFRPAPGAGPRMGPVPTDLAAAPRGLAASWVARGHARSSGPR